MSNIIVEGGRPLNGSIRPSANKNAVLPVLCATLLTTAPITLRNVPEITDVRAILDFFRKLGSEVAADFTTGEVRLRHGPDIRPDAVLPVGMRSSVMLIPPMLHRFGQAILETDAKGCTLGSREIDPHIDLFRAFGATVRGSAGNVVIELAGRMQAISHWLEYASVTTTENFIMCALSAQGTSRLVNAACEPHVQEMCAFLSRLGARLEGTGTSTLTVHGGVPQASIEHSFEEDFHEVCTFLALSAMTGGKMRIRNGVPHHFPLLDRTFAKFGVTIEHDGGWSRVAARTHNIVRPFTAHMLPKVEAAPWPYVPADLLPIFIALGACTNGSMMYWNKVYEGALAWSSELAKFGVQTVLCDPHRLITLGSRDLAPAEVESPYIIRVAIALLMVACAVPGRSTIFNADPIRRAHPRFAENLRELGAHVEWVGMRESDKG
jgi:UDP-N-acetylglucosamine 1-carboxyvinyltransferase